MKRLTVAACTTAGALLIGSGSAFAATHHSVKHATNQTTATTPSSTTPGSSGSGGGMKGACPNMGSSSSQ